MSGWYKRHRNITERPWFSDARTLQLYDYLEAKAYVTDGRYEGQLIRRGSLPTTRAEMMEVTGLSYKQVDRCLRTLRNYGDIIVKGNNQYSVVTICNYDDFGQSFDLFGTAEGTAEGTTHLLTKEERYKDNLISHNNIPYKKEREIGDVALEAKNRYNREFEGILPPCVRLSTAARLQVEECISRFGRQSIDMVFAQIKTEQFSQGKNKTGFIANFTFIFTPKEYQKYLERAILRQKKEQKPQPTVGVVEVELEPQRQSADDYEASMRKYAAEHPNSRAAQIVNEWDKNKTSQL